MTSGFVIRNGFLLMGGYDLSCSTTSLAVEAGAEQLDDTALCQSTKTVTAGLETVALGASGFVDHLTHDGILQAQVGGTTTHFSFGGTNTAGQPAYSLAATASKYDRSASVGELYKYDLSAMAQGNLTRGILLDSVTGVAATGNGTPRQWVALGATETFVATLHLLAISAGTITVRVESASLVGFGSPSTVLTFDPMTAVGSQQKTVTGAITNTFFRAIRTVITGTCSYVVVISKV